MNIHLSHSSKFDYLNELYWPLRETIAQAHAIFFPYSEENINVKADNIVARSQVIFAEVSYPSTRQGIELGWADAHRVPIVCFYRAGTKVSKSLKFVSETFLAYRSKEEMTAKLTEWLNMQAHQGKSAS